MPFKENNIVQYYVCRVCMGTVSQNNESKNLRNKSPQLYNYQIGWIYKIIPDPFVSKVPDPTAGPDPQLVTTS